MEAGTGSGKFGSMAKTKRGKNGQLEFARIKMHSTFSLTIILQRDEICRTS